MARKTAGTRLPLEEIVSELAAIRVKHERIAGQIYRLERALSELIRHDR
jgi:hypothetical protein